MSKALDSPNLALATQIIEKTIMKSDPEMNIKMDKIEQVHNNLKRTIENFKA